MTMTKIPRFRTEQEMREFWDTYDSAEYFEDMDDDEVSVEFKRDKGVLVIPLGEERARSVRGIALEEGVSSNVLLKNWIDESIKARGKLKGDRRIAWESCEMSLFGWLFKSEAEKRVEMDISDARIEPERVRQFVLDAFETKDYVLFEDAVSESGEARDIVHRAFTGLVDAGGYRMRWIEDVGAVVERVVDRK